MIGRTNCGGSGIGVRVTAVSSALLLPATARENTIAVITADDITQWQIGGTQPASPAAGQVWIACGFAGTALFNVLKRNGLMLSPYACMQYVSGAWAGKDAYVYLNGTWTQFSDLYYPIRSGVISPCYSVNYRSQASSGTLEITGDGPKIHAAASSGTYIEGFLEQPIWIDGEHQNMVVTMTGRGYMLNAGLVADLTHEITSVAGDFVKYGSGGQATNRTNYQVTVDISDLYQGGWYYFAWRTAGSGANSYQGNMTINDLCFE